jgi:hypothetical protein
MEPLYSNDSHIHMNQKSKLILLLFSGAVIGGVSGYCEARGISEPLWWVYSSTLVIIGLIFAWYHTDSDLHSYKRSIWLTGGILGMAIVAVPIYVVGRSAKGERISALLRLLGFVALLLIVGAIGSGIGTLFA